MIEKHKKTSDQTTADFTIKFNRGVNEILAVTNLPQNGFVEMDNWRISKAGDRIEKRDGLTAVTGATQATFGDKKLFGYHTYYNATPVFCELVAAEDIIWRKITGGSWTNIHAWSSSIVHPQPIQELQGKIFLVNEIQNRMLLSDGTDTQIGITAPTAIPTLTAGYDVTLENEDCSSLTGWTDADAGSGASTQVTYDSKSTFRFLNTGSSGDIASRYATLTGIAPEFTMEVQMYINTIGIYPDGDYIEVEAYNGRVHARVRIDQNDIYVYDGDYWVSCGVRIHQDGWYNYKFHVDTSDPSDEKLEVYVDDAYYGTYYCSNEDTTTTGRFQISVYGDTVATDVYTDWIKIGTTTGGKLNGLYRYAVTYRRYDANYPVESNPIKCLVGTATGVVVALDDMTSGGTYTGTKDRKIKVEIDGTGTPDTMKWSEDNGETWVTTTQQLTSTMYLNYGIQLTWGATTGHTAGDYWTFTCSSLAVSACHQKVTLSSIPTSSDTTVDQRRIYRTSRGGTSFYLVGTIYNNTETSWVDNLPDAALGVAMKEDRDVAPNGAYSVWWDDRFWILNVDDKKLYYSGIGIPEEFDTSNRYINIVPSTSDDEPTQLFVFKSYLYVFTRKQVFIIRKRASGTYGRYLICPNYGCIAPWSMQEAFNLLTFLSHRGIEVFDGCVSAPIEFSAPVRNTVDSIVSSTDLDLITSVHNRNYFEIWYYLGSTAGTVVCNYNTGDWYTFSWAKTPASLCEARDSSKDYQYYLGSTDGNLYTTDTGTQDGSTNITATGRIGWISFPQYAYIRYMELEHEIPTGNTLDIDPFINFYSGVKGSIGPTTYTAGGSTDHDDATMGGTYIGLTTLDYVVQIDATATPDTFKWSDDGGSTWDARGVNCATTATTLNNGVTVTFGATTGHVVGDKWAMTMTTGRRTLTGSTPAATDRELRRPIKDELEFALKGKYLAFKFTNDEAVGSTVKLHWAKIFYTPISRRGKIEGD